MQYILRFYGKYFPKRRLGYLLAPAGHFGLISRQNHAAVAVEDHHLGTAVQVVKLARLELPCHAARLQLHSGPAAVATSLTAGLLADQQRQKYRYDG